MSTPLDGLDYDYERSRAAVAVACLRWLRCTGPATGVGDARATPRDVADPSPIAIPTALADDRSGPPHPLWDRWLDG